MKRSHSTSCLLVSFIRKTFGFFFFNYYFNMGIRRLSRLISLYISDTMALGDSKGVRGHVVPN